MQQLFHISFISEWVFNLLVLILAKNIIELVYTCMVVLTLSSQVILSHWRRIMVNLLFDGYTKDVLDVVSMITMLFKLHVAMHKNEVS